MTDKMPQTLQDADVMRIAAKLVQIPEKLYPGLLALCKALQAKEKPATPTTEREL